MDWIELITEYFYQLHTTGDPRQYDRHTCTRHAENDRRINTLKYGETQNLRQIKNRNVMQSWRFAKF